MINIKKYLMNRLVGFTRKILGVLEEFNISFDHMPSGIDNISIIMRTNQIQGKESQVLNAIRKRCEVDELSIDHDLAVRIKLLVQLVKLLTPFQNQTLI